MSDIVDRLKITSVDGPYDTWSRTIDFDYEGISYGVILNYHELNGYTWAWFDESKHSIEEPSWLSDDDGLFYSKLGDRAHEF